MYLFYLPFWNEKISRMHLFRVWRLYNRTRTLLPACVSMYAACEGVSYSRPSVSVTVRTHFAFLQSVTPLGPTLKLSKINRRDARSRRNFFSGRSRPGSERKLNICISGSNVWFGSEEKCGSSLLIDQVSQLGASKQKLQFSDYFLAKKI